MSRNQLLVQRAVRIVGAPAWGGGLHRDHLAKLMGFASSWDREFKIALLVAYRRGLISFCGPWVVTPAHMRETAHAEGKEEIQGLGQAADPGADKQALHQAEIFA